MNAAQEIAAKVPPGLSQKIRRVNEQWLNRTRFKLVPYQDLGSEQWMAKLVSADGKLSIGNIYTESLKDGHIFYLMVAFAEQARSEGRKEGLSEAEGRIHELFTSVIHQRPVPVDGWQKPFFTVK
jgi:hypothetical protein